LETEDAVARAAKRRRTERQSEIEFDELFGLEADEAGEAGAGVD